MFTALHPQEAKHSCITIPLPGKYTIPLPGEAMPRLVLKHIGKTGAPAPSPAITAYCQGTTFSHKKSILWWKNKVAIWREKAAIWREIMRFVDPSISWHILMFLKPFSRNLLDWYMSNILYVDILDQVGPVQVSRHRCRIAQAYDQNKGPC